MSIFFPDFVYLSGHEKKRKMKKGNF